MLERTGDDSAGSRTSEAKEGQVVRLGGAAGEEDFVGGGVEEMGNTFARVFEGLARLPAGAVAAGGVAGPLQEIRLHRLPDRGQKRRGGVVVEVDQFHGEK